MLDFDPLILTFSRREKGLFFSLNSYKLYSKFFLDLQIFLPLIKIVELKISSHTPLYAAVEVLSYGLVYWASRQDKAKNLDYLSEDRPVLKARKITLCVLAPPEYYRRCSLEWLQTVINDGLKNFIQGDLKMDFRFEQFHFTWTHKMTANDLSEPFLREAVYQ